MIIHTKKVRQPKNLRLFKKNYAIVYFFLITPKKDYITCFFFFFNLYHCFFFLDLFPIYITTLYFSKETHRFTSFLTKGFSNNASTIILTKKVCQPKNLRCFKKNYVIVCFFLITPKKGSYNDFLQFISLLFLIYKTTL